MKRKLEPNFLRGVFKPETFNSDDNTIDIVFATEAEVIRRGWDGKFIEILECSEKAVRLDRLNAGGPVLDMHRAGSVKEQLGVVERAWVKNKECWATIRFSKKESVKETVADVLDGIIRNVSVGYNPYEGEETTGADGKLPTIRMTDWEPMELTLATIPADFKAGVRSASSENVELIEVEITRKNIMEEVKKVVADETRAAETPTPPAVKPETVDVESVRSEATTAERNRQKEIKLAVRSAGLEDSFADTYIESGANVADVRTAVLAELAKKQDGTHVRGVAPSGWQGEEAGKVETRKAMEDVLLHRSAPGIFKLEGEKAIAYRNATLIDLATESLKQRGIDVGYGVSKEEIVKRAMSSTDYPILLGNVVNRSLRQYYEAAPAIWKAFARQVTANDFKDISSIQFGGNIGLEEIKEGGEYKLDTMKESGDKFALKTWGKKIAITRRAIINDDLGGFMRATEMFGRGAAETQNAIVWGLFTQNSGGGRKLADNVNLFHASHNNLAGTGAVLSLTSLNAARVAMARQKGLKNEVIHVSPKFLVVPPELEVLALQLVNSTIVPNSTAQANPLYGAFTVLVDVHLTDPTAWYVISDPSMIDVVKFAYLSGQEGLYTEQKENFDNDNLEIKVRTDFNATIEEHRGVYKNAGA